MSCAVNNPKWLAQAPHQYLARAPPFEGQKGDIVATHHRSFTQRLGRVENFIFAANLRWQNTQEVERERELVFFNRLLMGVRPRYECQSSIPKLGTNQCTSRDSRDPLAKTLVRRSLASCCGVYLVQQATDALASAVSSTSSRCLLATRCYEQPGPRVLLSAYYLLYVWQI
eukprot:scaffold2718_cov103-Isochrysis_galbana.AAC.15